MTEQKQIALPLPPAATASSEVAMENVVPNISLLYQPSSLTSVNSKSEDALKFNRKYSPHAGQSIENIGDIPNDSWIKKHHWTDTPTGRAAIEFIARITLGGMFFALMGRSKTSEAMNTYDPSTHLANPNKTILERIAFGIDQTISRVMKSGFKTYYGGNEAKAEAAVRFRDTRNSATGQTGRSLGAEMTVVTADFAAMSAGTAIARETLLGILNPNERNAWLKDGKFNLSHIGRRLLSKAWEIVSYNAGEDAAVALPYVFFLRGCRNFIDKRISPGFRFGSDHVDNGGSIVVDGAGFARGEHQVAGILDLQARFTVYNVFTQMYRDSYNSIAERLKGWRDNHFVLETPDWIKNPASIPERFVNRMVGTARYMAISTIRSLLQMTPAVPFFSIVRAPASKPQGLAVHPEYGMLMGPDGVPLRRDQRPNSPSHAYYAADSGAKITWSNLSDDSRKALGLQSPRNPFADRKHTTYDPFGFGRAGRPLFYSGLSNATDQWGKTIHDLARLPFWQKGQQWFWNMTGHQNNSAEMSRQAALAGMPYATYFSAKVFFREQFVNEQMNLSIGRMLDGILSLNLNEMHEGVLEIQRTMMGLPFRDPNRQAELIANHRYHPNDKSPVPENWSGERHAEYLKASLNKKEPNQQELTAQISQLRADSYAAQALATRNQITKKETGWAEHQSTTQESVKQSLVTV